MTHEERIGRWVHQLWGVTVERQAAAQARIASWRIQHVERELAPFDADGALAAVFLVESIDRLVVRGVPESKLLSKLRGDSDVWPAWAEIRAAGLLAKHIGDDVNLAMEADRSRGRHADLTLTPPGTDDRHSVEFKAIGLSDAEVEFSRAMAPHLTSLLPRKGIVTMHLPDTDTTISLNRDQRRHHKREAERRAKYIHPVGREIAATVVVGHGTEHNYLRRLTARFREALKQLPSEDQCWVAFHWSNGAPASMVRTALARADVPDHIAGIVIVGSVAIPGRLDNYLQIAPAPFDQTTGDTLWESDADVSEAQAVLKRVEESAGVRPSLVRAPWQGQIVDFVRRTGDRRILPFNLVLVPDPPALVGTRNAPIT